MQQTTLSYLFSFLSYSCLKSWHSFLQLFPWCMIFCLQSDDSLMISHLCGLITSLKSGQTRGTTDQASLIDCSEWTIVSRKPYHNFSGGRPIRLHSFIDQSRLFLLTVTELISMSLPHYLYYALHCPHGLSHLRVLNPLLRHLHFLCLNHQTFYLIGVFSQKAHNFTIIESFITW